MAGEAELSETVGQGDRGFRVPAMYHPSLDVLDLDEAERWYERIFGVSSDSLLSLLAKLPPRPGSGYPPNYSTFTLIGDVVMDSIDPTRYVFDGIQRLPTVSEPHLRLISWYIDDMDACFRALRRNGIRVTNQLDEIVEGNEAPLACGSDMRLFYTLPEDTGLRYAFSTPSAVKASDRRSEPGWALRPPSSDDPLGLERCSHHTILTDRPERQLKLLRDVLGGTVFRGSRSEVLGARCTYVCLGDSIVELAVPDRDTPAYADWAGRAPADTYHALTWKVVDLARAERHLRANGVRIQSRTDDTIVTDPASSLGVPWGFSSVLIPDDPRIGR